MINLRPHTTIRVSRQCTEIMYHVTVTRISTHRWTMTVYMRLGPRHRYASSATQERGPVPLNDRKWCAGYLLPSAPCNGSPNRPTSRQYSDCTSECTIGCMCQCKSVRTNNRTCERTTVRTNCGHPPSLIKTPRYRFVFECDGRTPQIPTGKPTDGKQIALPESISRTLSAGRLHPDWETYRRY